MKAEIKIVISLEEIINTENYFSLSGMGRTRLFSDGNELVSWSLGGLKSRRIRTAKCRRLLRQMLLPSFSPGAPALLSGNASPVPAGPSLLLDEHELLLLLSENKKSASASCTLAGLACCPHV